MCTWVKRWLNAQEETLALSGTLRYLDSSCKTKAPPRRYPAERQYASSGSPGAFFGQQTPLWCNQGSIIEAQSSEHRRRSAVEEMYLHVCSLCTAICTYAYTVVAERNIHMYSMYVYAYICMCVCLYVCTYVYVCTLVYMYVP